MGNAASGIILRRILEKDGTIVNDALAAFPQQQEITLEPKPEEKQ